MVLDLMIIGLAITLEPVTIVAFILILGAQRGIRKGLAFLLGWMACLVAVIAAVVLITGGKPPEPHTAPSCGLVSTISLTPQAILNMRSSAAGAPEFRTDRPQCGTMFQE